MRIWEEIEERIGEGGKGEVRMQKYRRGLKKVGKMVEDRKG